MLLIEPVWNRNLSINQPMPIMMHPFNRTSMESKRANGMSKAQVIALLIEPVWNRNTVKYLITHDRHILLIEPVWNRNHFYRCCQRRFTCLTFNRTSMESKQRKARQRWIVSKLLIEPVWNRNVSRLVTVGLSHSF